MAVRGPIRRALISVYDKTGIVDFARALHDEFGIEIISTGGTAKVLTEAGLPVTLVENLTGFPELLDGRVKTLHPKIFAAILADRDNPEHMRQLAELGIEPIDMVVVNLYPFEQTIQKPGCTFEEAMEMIDIGGVALLRAAAKNHNHVLVAGEPDWHDMVLEYLRSWDDDRTRLDALRSGAFSAYWATTAYDGAISAWLSLNVNDGLPEVRVLRLWNWGRLRYGENPHQSGELLSLYGHKAALDLTAAEAGVDDQDDVQSAISYNNYTDANAALELCAELARSHLWDRSPDRSADSNVWDRSPDRSPPPDRSVTDETFRRRHLPHIQQPGATYFVTFRLRAGELSAPERDRVLAACRFWHGRKMTLHAACVMPDHVHLLLTPRESSPGQWVSLTELLRSIKGYTGHEICSARGQPGPLWADESFDRIMRNAREYQQTWDYMYANPRTAGLVDRPEQYSWFWHSETGFGELMQGEEMTGRETGPTEPGQLTGRETGPTKPRQLTGQETGPTEPSQVTGQETGPTTTTGARIRACCFIKHTNACGAAVAPDPIEAYRAAYLGDPNAAMGGVLAVNFEVTPEFAETVMETYQRFGQPLKQAGQPNAPQAFFLEVWLAPSFDEEAVRLIRGELDPTPERPNPPKKEWGRRVRLLAVGDMSTPPDPDELEYRSIAGGMLVQTRDLVGLDEEQWRVVTQRSPTEGELNDLRLAWLIAKHTKSNAVSICKDGMLIGNGAGQMSRVMSCRLATWLAKDNGHEEKLKGAAAASDGFFPFRDGPDLLADAGVTALIQPGGSKRDREVIEACDARGLAMVVTGTRHFKH